MTYFRSPIQALCVECDNGSYLTADSLSMGVRDCIRYKNTLKHFIHLRSNRKRVAARFAT